MQFVSLQDLGCPFYLCQTLTLFPIWIQTVTLKPSVIYRYIFIFYWELGLQIVLLLDLGCLFYLRETITLIPSIIFTQELLLHHEHNVMDMDLDSVFQKYQTSSLSTSAASTPSNQDYHKIKMKGNWNCCKTFFKLFIMQQTNQSFIILFNPFQRMLSIIAKCKMFG